MGRPGHRRLHWSEWLPTTDLAIAPIAFAPLAKNSASAIASPALTLPAPTAKPNASSKPLCVSGPMSATTPTPKNATSSFPPGCTTTTSPALMVVSVTLHLSAALLRKVKPLEGSQPAPVVTGRDGDQTVRRGWRGKRDQGPVRVIGNASLPPDPQLPSGERNSVPVGPSEVWSRDRYDLVVPVGAWRFSR